MNNIYQSIWNAKSGTFVAASEHAKSGGKKTASASKSNLNRGVGFALKSLAACVMLAAGFNVYALPTGGEVAAGSASISGSAGSTTINQTTQNVSINWQSFNIGKGETVNFAQPNSSAIALNRVLGSDPSSILGNLNANGKVFLINPNGVLFGVTRYRFDDDTITRLHNLAWWNWPVEQISRNLKMITGGEITVLEKINL